MQYNVRRDAKCFSHLSLLLALAQKTRVVCPLTAHCELRLLLQYKCTIINISVMAVNVNKRCTRCRAYSHRHMHRPRRSQAPIQNSDRKKKSARFTAKFARLHPFSLCILFIFFFFLPSLPSPWRVLSTSFHNAIFTQ